MPQRVVHRQHMVGAAAGSQGQHGFALEGVLRQHVQKHFQEAAVRCLVDRRGHNHHIGLRHLPDGAADGGVAKISQQQSLGRHIAHLQPVHVGAQVFQTPACGFQQGGGARALRRAAFNQKYGHSVSGRVVGLRDAIYFFV